MAGRRSRLIWIILGAIVLVVAALSIYNCANKDVEVKATDLNNVIEKMVELDKSSLTVAELDSLSADNEIVAAIKKINRDFNSITLAEVVIDGYDIDFSVVLKNGNNKVATLDFTTTFGRTNDEIKFYRESLKSIGLSFTDPNAGSIWSSLLPLFGSLLIAIIFFVLIMQTQGGTKGAMSFAKTNAR
ncbi:MAG: hypothetical protein J5911_03140, partial [Clostridia bacterium]|nr:hypothetical protein [Clostridia bacterium]